ncbi:MAG: ABC transporter permease, partial [Chloroflexota bacterium]
MQEVVQGFGEAWQLLVSGDPEVWSIAWLSLRVSLTATVIALVIGVPLGAGLALLNSPGKTAAVGVVHAGMALPPVVAGLAVSILLWRSGPFGSLGLLYSPTAMVIAQAVIATPIVAGLTHAAV